MLQNVKSTCMFVEEGAVVTLHTVARDTGTYSVLRTITMAKLRRLIPCVLICPASHLSPLAFRVSWSTGSSSVTCPFSRKKKKKNDDAEWLRLLLVHFADHFSSPAMIHTFTSPAPSRCWPAGSLPFLMSLSYFLTFFSCIGNCHRHGPPSLEKKKRASHTDSDPSVSAATLVWNPRHVANYEERSAGKRKMYSVR